MRGKMGRPLLLKANVALAILLLARLGTCEAMMGTLGPLRAKRWGDGGQAGLLLHLRGGQASEDDVQRIEEMAEEMRKRIPDDEELQAVEEEARVDMSWRPGAAQALREELGSFQIDVEGADGRTSTAQGREEDAKEEEDLFGPAGLLRDFWRLEDGSSMGSRLLNKPSVPLPETKDAQQAGGSSAVGAAEFASAVRSANLGTFEAAELLPATCGADRVFGLPLVEEADDAQLKEAAAGLFSSPQYQDRLASLLRLCVDGQLPKGYACVASALQICLAVSTTARIMGVLQRDERLFKDYWDKEGCCGGKGVGESEGSKCKLDSDVAVARQVLEECAGEKAEPGAGGGEEGELRRWVEGWMTGELLFSRLSLQEGMSVLLAVADGKGSDELLRLAVCSFQMGNTASSPGRVLTLAEVDAAAPGGDAAAILASIQRRRETESRNIS